MSLAKSRLRIALVVLVALFAAWRVYVARGTGSAVARLHALGLPADPAELDAWYKAVPADLNLANPIANAAQAARLPRTTNAPYVDGLQGSPARPVAPESLAAWRALVAARPEVTQHMQEARRRTASRYPVNFRNGFNTLLPHLGSTKALAQFLALASLVDAESGDDARAAADIQGILDVGRSLEGEPILISQLVRFAVLRIAVNAAADNLPRARLDDAAWKSLQEAFARASRTNATFTGLVGEAASTAGFLAASPAEAASSLGLFGGGPGGPGGTDLGPKAGMALYAASGIRAVDGRFCIDRFADYLDAARHPFPGALDRYGAVGRRVMEESAKPAKGLKLVSCMVLPGMDHALNREAECVAVLRSAEAGCAVERFRLARGHVPATLDELVPAFLDAVPSDPFDGKPLRYRTRGGDRYVVYSVGEDKADDGGEPRLTVRGAKPRQTTFDIGFTVTGRR